MWKSVTNSAVAPRKIVRAVVVTSLAVFDVDGEERSGALQVPNTFIVRAPLLYHRPTLPGDPPAEDTPCVHGSGALMS